MEKKLINSYPATRWNDSTPVGNGVLGASVYGAIYDERILINHEDLYNYSNKKEIPDISAELKTVRALMDEGRYKEANDHYTNALKRENYVCGIGKYYPAFDLHMVFELKGAFTDYQRSLDMENGVCTVTYKDGGKKHERTVFASKTNRVVVVNIKNEEPFSVKLTLERHSLKDCPDKELYSTFSSFSRDKIIYSQIETIGHLDFSGMVKVVSTDGTVSAGNDKKRNIDMSGERALKDYLRVENATEITLLIDIKEKKQSPERMERYLDKIPYSYSELLEKHKRRFKALFNKTRLSLTNKKNVSNEQLLLDSYNGKIDTRLLEKMADYGRYLLISSSTDCKYPANLQGMWNGEYSPAWACTFFNNENIQMAYWQACQGGLESALLPLFSLYDSLKDDYRENAKKLYGCRGILLPLFMDNRHGLKCNLLPHVLYWTGSSAWISAIYYEYYLFTRDEKFLRERAYPFMRESAQFYEDFYVTDENGMLKSYPSNSPENRASGDFEGARELSISINSTMDFALLKELLTNLISSAKTLNVDGDKIPLWKGMIEKIPPYEINGDGAIKEWLHKDFLDNYHHRHQSHIYPLFPGYEIDEDNKELFEASKVAVEKRLVIGLKEQTGWSLAHMANIFARLGNAEKAMECLSLLLRFCTGENLYTYHNDWRNMGVTLEYLHAGKAPFQIDANMGFTSAVYEMLLFSTPEKIKILPALPKEWESGSIKGLRTRTGCQVSINWTKNKASVKIKALLDTDFVVSAREYKLNGYSLGKKEGELLYASLKKGEELTLTYQK